MHSGRCYIEINIKLISQSYRNSESLAWLCIGITDTDKYEYWTPTTICCLWASYTF